MENNNTRYWAIVNGVRLGPMGLGELARLSLSPETPVWHPGLPDWCAASTIPELRAYMDANIPPVPSMPPVPPVSSYFNTQVPQTPYIPEVPRQQQPMPPTYLVWSIITMLLCCVPTGIVAIVYSSKVNSRFTSGDYEGAKKASENAAIWILATVVLGLIALPFQIIMALV